MVSAQAVKWLHRFYGVKAPNLSLRGGQRPTWRPEREARGSALGVQSREGSCVFAGLSCYPTGYCEIATAPLGPRNDNSGVHTILLLAMTRQESARCTSALLRLNHPRTRRSLTAAKFYYLAFCTRHSSKSATYQYQPSTSSGSHCVKYAISGIWPSAR